jgi:hypothetical protein
MKIVTHLGDKPLVTWNAISSFEFTNIDTRQHLFGFFGG